MSQPPGYMLNNPFDLMFNPNITWDGQVTPQAPGTSLLAFDTAVEGLRAGMKDAHTKVYVDGLNTLNLFLPKFAPPESNDTAGYIANMSLWLGIGADDPIDISTVESMVLWAKCINRQEIGNDPITNLPRYSDALYAYAAELALGLPGGSANA